MTQRLCAVADHHELDLEQGRVGEQEENSHNTSVCVCVRVHGWASGWIWVCRAKSGPGQNQSTWTSFGSQKWSWVKWFGNCASLLSSSLLEKELDIVDDKFDPFPPVVIHWAALTLPVGRHLIQQ